MGRVHLTVAMGDYDHTRELASGRVAAQGLDLTFLDLQLEEIVFRCLKFHEWDVSEMSMGVYASMRSRGDESLIAIPVFPSRMFRHSAFYVSADSDITELSALRGRRVGVPEWAQTACVYARALVVHDAGVPLDEIDWYQSGVDETNRGEKAEIALPSGVHLTPRLDRSLSDLLGAGEIDAIISARPPAGFLTGEGRIRRLLTDPAVAAEEHFGRTRIYPIMHVVVLKRSTYDRYAWIAANLVTAFSEAKAGSLRRCVGGAIAHFPIPLVSELASHWADLMGGDLWPYGVEANRPTLDAFLGYCVEQGIATRRMTCEELFAPETLAVSRS